MNRVNTIMLWWLWFITPHDILTGDAKASTFKNTHN